MSYIPNARILAEGGYEAVDSSNPFQANWWGNPNYDGRPGW